MITYGYEDVIEVVSSKFDSILIKNDRFGKLNKANFFGLFCSLYYPNILKNFICSYYLIINL